MKKHLKSLILITVFFITLPLHAHEARGTKPDESSWSHSFGEVGGYLNTGNTESSNLTTKSEILFTGIKFTNKLFGSFDFGTKDKKRNKQIFQFGDEVHYYLTDRYYLYGQIENVVNEFSPYRFTLSEVIGFGYFLVERPSVQLKLQTGPGLQQRRVRESGDTINNGIFGNSIALHWHINDKLRFNQKFAAHVPFTGPQQYIRYKSRTGLAYKLNSHLSLKLNNEVLHYSDIPQEAKNDRRTDTSTTFSVKYHF